MKRSIQISLEEPLFRELENAAAKCQTSAKEFAIQAVETVVASRILKGLLETPRAHGPIMPCTSVKKATVPEARQSSEFDNVPLGSVPLLDPDVDILDGVK